jgi:hypothetical protein
MGDGSGDLQKTWHEFVASLFSNETIIDIGAGLGKSKERLGKNNNKVTTQEINRAMMNKVDIICEIREIMRNVYDVVTSFDVVEHTIDPSLFIRTIDYIAKKAIFVTTPNVEYSPGPWHFTEEGFLELIKNNIEKYEIIKYYYRYKFSNGKDIIIDEKIDKVPMAFGVLIEK